MPPRPEELDIARSVAAQSAHGSIYSAQYGDSQKAAKANEMARRLGIPADVVEADLPNMSAEDRLRRAREAARHNPVYAGMMANPRFAAAAIDDDNLRPLAHAVAQVREMAERATQVHSWPRSRDPKIKGWSAGPGAENLSYPMQILAAADRRFEGLGAGMGRLLAATTPISGARPVFTRMAAESEEYAQWAPQRSSLSSWQDVKRKPLLAPMFGVEQLTTSFPDMVTLIAAFPGYIAARSGEIGQQRARNNGKTDASIGDILKAAPAATLSAYLDRLGLRGIGAAIANPALRATVTAATREAGTEFLQSGIEYLGSNLGTDAGWDGHEMVDQMVAGAVGGFFAGGIIGGGGGSINHGLSKIYESRAAQDAAATVDHVMEAASRAETRTSNPGDFEEVLNQQLEGRAGETLYIPGEQVAALFQEGNIAEHAFWGQHAAQVAEAVAIGGDVVIPLAAAATHLAGTPEWQALREHVRATPGGMSIVEAKQRQTPEEIEALAAQLTDEIERRVPEIQATRAVKKFATDMGYEGEQAGAITQLVAARLAVAAKLSGVSPTEMWKRWGLFSEKTTQADFEALGKTGALAQSANSPEFRRWFGDSRVVDETGSPRVVYHGTGAMFDTFEATGGTVLEGVFFSSERDGAFDWGLRRAGSESDVRVVPAYISLKNPADQDSVDEAIADYRDENGEEPSPAQLTEYLQEQGYDGFLDQSSFENALEIVAFNPSQIKATENRGTFDPNDPNIYNQPTRGNISLLKDESGTMTGAVIRAFESANFSTAIHELGHFWLEDLKGRADADWQTIQQWFAENGHDAGESIPVEAHEMWARGMERYIFEGKAPSKKLKPLFAKMRDWMMDLYRSVTAFNSPISPEIRDVMDRMFASDEEIAIQREEMRLATANLEGLMTEAEQEDYLRVADDVRNDARDKLIERILSTLRRERTDEANARRKAIRTEVETVVDAEPVFRALRMLRVGIEQEEGEATKVRLSSQWLIDAYGEEILPRLPQWIQPIHGDADTMEADELAEMAGFESGDQMVVALVSLEEGRMERKAAGDKRSPRQYAVDEMTQARVRDEIGDPLQNIEEEAQAVLASERQADLMSLELRALARKTRQRPTPWQVARDWAETRIAASRTRDALTGAAIQMYVRNAGKAGRGAEEALIKGDFEEAFRFKQQQMLNLALLSEGKKAKDRVEKAVRRLQRVAAKKTMASVDQDYLDQAHQLLEGVEMRTRPLSQVDRRRAFEVWYADQVAQGREPIVPPQYQRTLGQVNWQQLTVAELLELDDVVQQVVQLGRLKQRLRDGQEERDFAEVRAEAVAQLATLRQLPRTDLMDEGRSRWLTFKRGIRWADAALIKIEVLCDWMDGRNSNGLFNRLVFRPLADAQGRKTRMVADYAGRLDKIISEIPASHARVWERTVDTPELINRETGEPFDITHGGVVMMALNWGNEGNRQRLADGYDWSPDAIQSVLDRVLTQDDWTFVQKIWAEIDTLGPELFEMERRVNGVAPPKVEGTEVVTPFGTFKGGYFPAVYDLSKDRNPPPPSERDLFSGDYQRATTRAGSTHERSARVSRPILLNMSVINRHIEEVIHDITHREAIIAVDKLTSDREVQKAVSDAFGPEYAALFRPWLKQIANEPSGGGAAKSKIDARIQAAFRSIRTRVTIVGLGFRLGSALAQVAGAPNIVGEIGAARFLQGVTQMLAHPVSNPLSGQSLYRTVTEKSAEMAGRFANMDRDVRENLRQHARTTGPMAPIRFIQRHAYDLILAMDMLITLPGWVGAYEKALGQGMEEQEAIYYADKVIRVSQGAGGSKDQAAIMTSHEATRFFTMFFSYFSALYNRQRDIVRLYGEAVRERDIAKAVEAAQRSFWIMLLPPVLDAAIRGLEPEDEDEDGEKSWAETGRWLMRKILFGNMASIPGVRDVLSAIDSGYGYKVSPVQGIGETFIKSLDDAQDLADEDAEPSSTRLKRAFMLLGYVAKLPTGYLGQEAQLGLDIYEGEQEAPETASEAYSAATRGKVEVE